jgi:predicted Zn finger-like uncharacterized protein
MHTQCPHCETKFRLTETQVNIADGFVRCGICKEVFNAFEVANQHIHQSDHQESLHDEKNIYMESSTLEQTALDELEGTIHENTGHENNVLDIENRPVEEQAVTESINENPINFNEITATDDVQKDAFDFFNEDINDSPQHVVPDELRGSSASTAQVFSSNILWSIGILLLITSLFAEYIWFNRHQLSQIPQLQVWIEKLCQQVNCNNILVRDASKIELITRNIYSHPNENNALMINITMKNNADFAQPYPIMQIDFSDIRGGTVAARRFLPTEYLQITSKQLRLLQPDASTSFTMEVQDPGKQAKTYEFIFL